MTAPAVHVRELGKTYKVYSSPWDRISEALVRRPRHREFVALAGIDFDLPRGEGLGVIGQNGAGKSTLLKILAGIVTPSAGSADVRGKSAAILEIGSGFHPEFTGRQNIRLNAAMLGLTPQELEVKTPEIIEFSELGDFIDRPVKTYSTGMAMRLGFAIATQIEPDVLIIDEALSVGDGYFQKKCMDHLQRFLAEGGTLLFCSHALYYVSAFCHRALWLRQGRVERLGPTDQVVRDYEVFLQHKDAARTVREGGSERAVPGGAIDEPGRRPARIVDVRLIPEPGPSEESPTLGAGDSLELEITWETTDPQLPFHLGVGLNRSDDLEVADFSTFSDGLEPWVGERLHRGRLVLPDLPLVKGEFTLYLFLLDETGLHVHDQRILQRAFLVSNPGYRFGIVQIGHRWERSDGRRAPELSPAGDRRSRPLNSLPEPIHDRRPHQAHRPAVHSPADPGRDADGA